MECDKIELVCASKLLLETKKTLFWRIIKILIRRYEFSHNTAVKEDLIPKLDLKIKPNNFRIFRPKNEKANKGRTRKVKPKINQTKNTKVYQVR